MTSIKDKQTSFYDIKVYAFDSKGNTRDAKLTPEIKRLIDKVAITEASTSALNKGVSSLEITFKETSYLPQDNNLRPQQPHVHGQITNRPGAILDLRFDSEKGFTFVSKEEVESGKTDKTRTQNKKTEPIIYLFQSGNLIEVTWGYLDPSTVKSQTFEIKAIKLNGGGSGDGSVTISALPPGLKSATKNKVSKGVTFFDTDLNNNPMSLKQVLWKVANANQLKLVFDGVAQSMNTDDYPSGTLKYDPAFTNGDSAPAGEVPFRIPRDSTIYQFLDDLAELYQAVVEIRQVRTEEHQLLTDLKISRNNATKFENVLFFTPYKKIYDVEKVGRTLRYKDNDGIVLSYNIDDMNGSKIRGATTSAITDDTLRENESSVVEQIVIPTKKIEVKDRVDYSLEQSFIKHLGVSPAGTSTTLPSTRDEASDQMSDKSTSLNSFPITISLNTIGDTTLKNETVYIDNIGTRYSGTYDIFSIVHNIGNNGYTCSLQGKSQYVSEGGTSVKDITAEEKENKIKSEKVQVVTVSPKV